MAAGIFNPMTVLATRPRDAMHKIAAVLGSVDCTSCARCCREKTGLAVYHREPSAQAFFDIMKSRVPQDRIREYDTMVAVSPKQDGSCHFLAGSQCSVYGIRPLLCRTFPFVLRNSTVPNGTARTPVLSSHCPPLEQLKADGVLFLYLSDILMRTDDILSAPHDYPDDIRSLATQAQRQDESGICISRMLYCGLEGLNTELGMAHQEASITGAPPLVLSDPANRDPFFPIM